MVNTGITIAQESKKLISNKKLDGDFGQRAGKAERIWAKKGKKRHGVRRIGEGKRKGKKKKLG